MKKALVSAVAALMVAWSASAFEATVVSTKGKVEVLKGSDWQALAEGATISKGDVIQTGFKSELVLKVKESLVTVSPLSRLTVEQLAEKASQDSTRLFLDTGSLKSDVKKSENRRTEFTVRSPVATASVRGTVLTVENKFGSTDVTTHEGVVAVWKGTNEATMSTDSEDSEETAPTGTGNSAQDIAAAAPRGAITVSAGQNAGVSEDKQGIATPQQRAVENAVGLRSNTMRAFQNESVQLATAALPPSNGAARGDRPAPNAAVAATASISVTATLEE